MWLVLAAVLTLPPGYVADSLCAECHRELAATYTHVGMSQSFSRPRASNVIEDFDAPPYFHGKSNQYFEMRKRGDDVVFRRYQLVDGKQTNVFEQVVDWILGSGHRSRTYLYATPNGELYQLPIAWYSQPRAWPMSARQHRRDHGGTNACSATTRTRTSRSRASRTGDRRRFRPNCRKASAASAATVPARDTRQSR